LTADLGRGQGRAEIVVDVQPGGGRDDRDLQSNAGTQFTEGLEEPLVMHPPAVLTEQVPARRLRIVAIFDGANALEEAHAVASHQP
jgi:hypothetical protein